VKGLKDKKIMKILWCWRCKMGVEMLDEEEYLIAHELYVLGMKNITTRDRKIRFKKLLDYYRELTGFEETEPNAIMHHRIAQYGNPCEKCSKPYRTPQASFCAACGSKRK
jgi:hypothetical protein